MSEAPERIIVAKDFDGLFVCRAEIPGSHPYIRADIAERELAEARAQSVGDWSTQRENDALTIKYYELKDERDRLAAELAEERAKPKLKIKRVERPPLVIDESAWPNGCHSLSSCSRHLACMYYGCQHQDRNVKPEIEAAIARRASLQIGEQGE